MLATPTAAVRVRMPGTVIAGVVLLAGAAGLGILLGPAAGLTILTLPNDAGADSAWVWIEVPQYTTAVMWACLWLNLAWFLVRTIAAFTVARGSRTARLAAITAETVAVLVSIAMLFVYVEGDHKTDTDPFLLLRAGAGIAILFSAVLILVLLTPSAKAWCDRR